MSLSAILDVGGVGGNLEAVGACEPLGTELALVDAAGFDLKAPNASASWAFLLSGNDGGGSPGGGRCGIWQGISACVVAL